jgi:cell division protein FtsN
MQRKLIIGEMNQKALIQMKMNCMTMNYTAKNHTTVAGGFESVQNAEKLVDELNLLGFEAHLSGFSPKGLNRVAYGAYKNRSEALKAMRWIQSMHNAQAWMTTQ